MANDELDNKIGLQETQTDSGSEVAEADSFSDDSELSDDNKETDEQEETDADFEEQQEETESAEEETEVEEQQDFDDSEEWEAEEEAQPEAEAEQSAEQQSEAVTETAHEDTQNNDNEGDGHVGQSAEGDSEYEYVKQRIRPELIAGTDEFFDSISNDARAKVEEITGEEFDEFDQKHMARYQYYLGVFAESRKQAMTDTIAKYRQEYADKVRGEKQAKNYSDLKQYLDSELKTQEEINAFRNICNRMPHEDFAKIDYMASNGDLSGVKSVVARIKGAKRRVSSQPISHSYSKPNKSQNRRSGSPRLSDLFK